MKMIKCVKDKINDIIYPHNSVLEHYIRNALTFTRQGSSNFKFVCMVLLFNVCCIVNTEVEVAKLKYLAILKLVYTWTGIAFLYLCFFFVFVFLVLFFFG